MADEPLQFKSESDRLAWLGTDGLRWAETFLQATNLENAGPDFRSTVHSWFANAIEVGRTAGHSSAFEEMKHAARNMGFDTADFYTPGQLIERVYQEIPGDHQCL